MGAFENVRMEALAQALAKGLPLHAATKEAGFSRQNDVSKRRAARADVVARVAEIAAERIETAADVVPLIAQLTELATAAGKLGSAAGMTAARGLLVEAARLKGLLRRTVESHRVAAEPRVPVLSRDEWLKAFSPHWEERSAK